MNYTKMLIIGTLSSTILMGGATSASATDENNQDKQTRSVNTDGQIIFTPSIDEELTVIPPDTGSDVDINPEVPGTTTANRNDW